MYLYIDTLFLPLLLVLITLTLNLWCSWLRWCLSCKHKQITTESFSPSLLSYINIKKPQVFICLRLKAYLWVDSPSEVGNYSGQSAGPDGQAACSVAGVTFSHVSELQHSVAPSEQPALPWELFCLGLHEVQVLREKEQDVLWLD